MRPLQWQSQQPIRGQRPKTQDPGGRAGFAPKWPGEYGLKSGENGHLARPNGAADGPYCSHQPGPVCLEGGVSRWLVGVVVLGAELHQRRHAARGAQAPRRCAGRPGRDG
jgi:hypothetical protein